ncbi:MAG: cytochrome b [Novosphingobium sp.]|uniref:cytochrome b n=1 Tax=Novosphingobium sp. TaxID=1874826 RepID=UPI003C7C544C
MDSTNTSAARYSRGAIVLHWLIAVLIVLNIAAAFVSEEMSKDDRATVMANHKAIGIIVLLLTVLRIVWRLMHRPPPLLESLKAWEAALSRVVHAGFYFLMLAIPLTGWAMSSAFSKGAGVSLFGLVTVPALPVGYDKPTAGLFAELHELLAFGMIALIVLHVAGALKHQLIDKDDTLRRMVPWMN